MITSALGQEMCHTVSFITRLLLARAAEQGDPGSTLASVSLLGIDTSQNHRWPGQSKGRSQLLSLSGWATSHISLSLIIQSRWTLDLTPSRGFSPLSRTMWVTDWEKHKQALGSALMS